MLGTLQCHEDDEAGDHEEEIDSVLQVRTETSRAPRAYSLSHLAEEHHCQRRDAPLCVKFRQAIGASAGEDGAEAAREAGVQSE